MILSDKTIAENIDSGRIGIEPDITDEQIQPASLDLRLGEKAFTPETGAWHDTSDGLKLWPNTLYLCETKEFIGLPKSLAAQVTGRSSIGRKGIVIHLTAGWIDPGFEGIITLEVMNLTGQKQVITEGDRICQLIFFLLNRKSEGYDGQYQGQTEPQA